MTKPSFDLTTIAAMIAQLQGQAVQPAAPVNAPDVKGAIKYQVARGIDVAEESLLPVSVSDDDLRGIGQSQTHVEGAFLYAIMAGAGLPFANENAYKAAIVEANKWEKWPSGTRPAFRETLRHAWAIRNGKIDAKTKEVTREPFKGAMSDMWNKHTQAIIAKRAELIAGKKEGEDLKLPRVPAPNLSALNALLDGPRIDKTPKEKLLAALETAGKAAEDLPNGKISQDIVSKIAALTETINKLK